MSQQNRTKRMTLTAMLCALAYVAVVLIRIPILAQLPFLKYDPKDVVIVLGGLMLGPVSSVIISVVASLVEMLTIGTTGLWGLLMNVIASCAFAVPAAMLYQKRHSIKGAVMGLTAGVFFMTAMMMLWNYLITPIYMGTPREVVAGMLLPSFLPFNMLKGGINMALTLLLYKPLITALRRANILHGSEEQQKITLNVGVMAVAVVLLAGCILLALALSGKL